MSALEIAQKAVGEFNDSNGGKGGIAHVARLIGYKRPSLSLYLHGRYTAGKTKIEAAILINLVGRVSCPHLNETLAVDACKSHQERPMPISDKKAFRHWSACQTCPHNHKEEVHA